MILALEERRWQAQPAPVQQPPRPGGERALQLDKTATEKPSVDREVDREGERKSRKVNLPAECYYG